MHIHSNHAKISAIREVINPSLKLISKTISCEGLKDFEDQLNLLAVES
jgi:hypothetical protein